jgi:hypothetical protein
VVGRLSIATRREVVAAIRERYGTATRAEKGRILDVLVAVAGYHRKHAIRVLRRCEASVRPDRAHRGRVYGEADQETLIALWEASDRLCSKRLKSLIPVLLPALERHGRIRVDDEARRRLLAVSPATMDRLLSEVRVLARGGQRRRAGFSSAVRRTVPVRTFGDWNDPPPGYVEVDLMARGGTSVAGSFVQTVVLTDIAMGPFARPPSGGGRDCRRPRGGRPLALDQAARGQLRHRPGEHPLMHSSGRRPTAAPARGSPTATAVGTAPLQVALVVDALEIADQMHAEVASGPQRPRPMTAA